MRSAITPLRGRRSLPALAVLSLVVALAACGGVPAPTYCYQVTGATIHTVDLGMTIAGDLYREGKLSEPVKVKIGNAHDVYRPAAQAAVAGCKAVQTQGDADKFIAQIKVAADKVIETLIVAGVIR